MDPVIQFEQERKKRIENYGNDTVLRNAARGFLRESLRAQYSYNFTWMGRPIIQHPQDIMALQEIIWAVKPDLIVETGIAHGGSLVFLASMLGLLGGNGRVVGIDIDIRAHNRVEIEQHPMAKTITMIEGSSIDPSVVQQVKSLAANHKTAMVILDSNHTHEHVLQELHSYSSLVTPGSYLVVYDGVIEEIPESTQNDRPWGQGNNPLTAIREFLKESSEFEVDREIENKILVTAAPSGYLKRVSSRRKSGE